MISIILGMLPPTHQLRNTFGSWDVEKWHAAVAGSAFTSQNAKNTRGSDHFRRDRRRKSLIDR